MPVIREHYHEVEDPSNPVVPAGSAALTVDNTVDPPFEASTIIAPGATESAPDEATLSTVTILSATVELTNAQIKALPTTPVEIVPAPGAGSMLQFVGGNHILHLVGDYTNVEATADIVVAYADLVRASNALLSGDTGYLDYGGPVDLRGTFTPQISQSGGVVKEKVPDQLADDQALVILANNVAAGNFTGGNAANTLKVTVWYAVVDV